MVAVKPKGARILFAYLCKFSAFYLYGSGRWIGVFPTKCQAAARCGRQSSCFASFRAVVATFKLSVCSRRDHTFGLQHASPRLLRQSHRTFGGSWRFAVLYLVAGIGAGLTSAVWQQTVSVGASGSVFGLLAYGFVYERILMRHVQKTYGRKLRKGPYTGLVVANLILGLVVSSGGVIGIDNAAHLGGLLTGCCLTLFWIYWQGYELIPQNRAKRSLFFLH